MHSVVGMTELVLMQKHHLCPDQRLEELLNIALGGWVEGVKYFIIATINVIVMKWEFTQLHVSYHELSRIIVNWEVVALCFITH